MTTTCKLKQRLLDFDNGEELIYEAQWGEWTRKRTGETYDFRGSIAEGETAMLLSYLKDNDLTSILELTVHTKEDNIKQESNV